MLRNPNAKRYIESFEELVDMIKGSTSIDPFESAGDKRKRIKQLLSNYEAFCTYYFPEYCFAPFGKFHKNIQKEVYDKPNNIFLVQWSRGFAKSTHFGLFLPLFIKFNNRLNGMMVGSLNETSAAEKLADIQANLEGNQRIISDFGEQMSWGNWEDGMFKTKDDVAFYAYGKKQSPRGTRFKWKRPNYGLIDDLNEARQLKNDSIADEDKRWVIGELKSALWTREWWLPVAQNKFHDNAVTALLETDEEIKATVFRVDVEDSKGNSNWPENPDFSNERIKELKDTEGGDFIRERKNTPYEEGKMIKAEWLNQWVEPLPLNKYKTHFHYLDPSYKSTEKSDFKAWILVGQTEDLHFDILHAWVERTDSKEMWEHAFELEDELYPGATVNHAMEANFIQEDIHSKELERVEKDKGRRLRCVMDRRAKENKEERIATLVPLFKRGLIRFNIHQKNSTGMKLLRSQLLAFEKGSRINDDAPDGLESAIWMCERYSVDRSKKTRTGKMKKKTDRSM